RFPHISRVCADFGLDLARDRVPVRPGAHYMIGGVITDVEGRTNLENLWAAGEVTSSGLHGANRLASNSLLEGLVFGLRCGRNASAAALGMSDRFSVPAVEWQGERAVPDGHGQLDIPDLKNSLRSLMGRSVGIVRNEQELEAACKQLDFWTGYVCRRDLNDPSGWELQNMLLAARAMAAAALERRESRGVHSRSDFPEALENQRNHIVVRREQ
ncbi:MAG: FAD-binding protein, partial [Planctomycetaceae bacterium]